MTPEEYRAELKALGLTPAKPSYNGATLHQDREGQFVTMPDAEQLLPEERQDFIDLLIARSGYSRTN